MQGTIGDLISGARDDDHPAVIVPGAATLSYAALHQAVDDAANRLAIGPGDRVGISLPNGPEMIVTFLAIAACGAAAAPFNPALTEHELAQEMADLGVTRLLHQGAVRMKGHRLEIDGDSNAAIGHKPTATPDSVALLLHTSGTTSRPKTVPIRQANLVASSRAVATTYGLNPDDVAMCVMPLFHVHGLVASVLASLATGGTIILPPKFSASTFWGDVERYAVTWYTAVPTIHTIALNKAQEARPRTDSLRFVRSCSAPLPVATWKAYEAALDIPMLEAYGMTEAAHQMASNPLPPGERRPGTVGAATGVDIDILDDDWKPLEQGQPGEVAIRGPSVVDGYLDNPDANEASFRDGWFRTGDVGQLSSDGYLTLVGRIKELINRGGEKISPYEIENVLLTHPCVSEAAVYPVPDDKYGEAVGAVVVLKGEATPDQLRSHCADTMASFKVPARLTVLAEIPKGPTGKVQRRHLAALVGA